MAFEDIKGFMDECEVYNADVAALLKQANDLNDRRKTLVEQGKTIGMKIAAMNASMPKLRVSARITSADDSEETENGATDTAAAE